MNKIPIYFWLGCIALLLIFCFYFYIRGEIELKKEKEKEKKKEEQNAKIDKKTNEQIQSVTTGNVINNITNGSNILHDLAQKRK